MVREWSMAMTEREGRFWQGVSMALCPGLGSDARSEAMAVARAGAAGEGDRSAVRKGFRAGRDLPEYRPNGFRPPCAETDWYWLRELAIRWGVDCG